MFLAIMLVVVSLADLAVVIGLSMDKVVQSIMLGDDPAATEEAAPVVQETPSPLDALFSDLQAAIAHEPSALSTPTPEALEMLEAERQEALREEKINAFIDEGIRLSQAVGFGGSIYLIFLAPVVLLFSYTRKPKNQMLDMLIPVAGVLVILFVYVKGIHQLLGILPVQKVNLHELKNTIRLYAVMLQ